MNAAERKAGRRRQSRGRESRGRESRGGAGPRIVAPRTNAHTHLHTYTCARKEGLQQQQQREWRLSRSLSALLCPGCAAIYLFIFLSLSLQLPLRYPSSSSSSSSSSLLLCQGSPTCPLFCVQQGRKAGFYSTYLLTLLSPSGLALDVFFAIASSLLLTVVHFLSSLGSGE